MWLDYRELQPTINLRMVSLATLCHVVQNRSTGITQYLPFASIFVPFPKSHQKNF